MSSHSDVIVIGGGAIGICAAYYLWKEGLKVTILERDAICSGCSYGNAGLIVPSHFIPLAAPGMIARGLKWMFNPGSPFYIKPRIDFGLLRWMWRFYRACSERRMRRAMSVLRDLSMASRALFEELAEIDGVNFGFRKNGLLMLYKGERGHSECHEMVELAQEIGVEASELNEGQVADLHPNMRINAAGGVYFKQDCHLDPAHFVNGLSRYLEQRGVDMHPFTEVVGFGHSRGRISVVKTSRGEFSADEVVLAGGSWSPVIVRELGVRLPIQPAKGYSVTVKQPGKIPRIPLLLTEAKVAVTPLGDRLRVAGTLELSGLDLSVNQRRVNAILYAIPNYLPDFDIEPFTHAEVWCGLRPCTPDGLPFVGRFEAYPNLIAATGHAMLGISLAPITGKLVSEIALAQKPSIEISALSMARHKSSSKP